MEYSNSGRRQMDINNLNTFNSDQNKILILILIFNENTLYIRNFEDIETCINYYIENYKFPICQESINKVSELKYILSVINNEIQNCQYKLDCEKEKKENIFNSECIICKKTKTEKYYRTDNWDSYKIPYCFGCFKTLRKCDYCKEEGHLKINISKHPMFYKERCEKCIARKI